MSRVVVRHQMWDFRRLNPKPGTLFCFLQSPDLLEYTPVWCEYDFHVIAHFGLILWSLRETKKMCHNSLEVNDTLKPLHRWTNGPLPLKTIEANGWRTPKPSKNHWNQWSGGWKSFNGDGWVTPKPLKNNWKQWSEGWKTLNGIG